jgi:pimeloyl-ACP methyl ester carboxylesterase
VLLAAHDWGAYVGYLMVLRAPERFDGYLAMNIPHPWVPPRALLPNIWRIWYQVPLATFGMSLMRRTKFIRRAFATSSSVDPEAARIFADRFRHPVCARAGRDTYRTFLIREIPQGARNPERRRATVPIRVLFGTGDVVVPVSYVSPETANADDYTLETTDASHFVVDERPDLVRKKLVELAEETAPS